MFYYHATHIVIMTGKCTCLSNPRHYLRMKPTLDILLNWYISGVSPRRSFHVITSSVYAVPISYMYSVSLPSTHCLRTDICLYDSGGVSQQSLYQVVSDRPTVRTDDSMFCVLYDATI